MLKIMTGHGPFLVDPDFDYAYEKKDGKSTSFQFSERQFVNIPITVGHLINALPLHWLIVRPPNMDQTLTDDSYLLEATSKEGTPVLLNANKIRGISYNGNYTRIDFESGRFIDVFECGEALIDALRGWISFTVSVDETLWPKITVPGLV